MFTPCLTPAQCSSICGFLGPYKDVAGVTAAARTTPASLLLPQHTVQAPVSSKHPVPSKAEACAPAARLALLDAVFRRLVSFLMTTLCAEVHT